jgi:hypothetical protein
MEAVRLSTRIPESIVHPERQVFERMSVFAQDSGGLLFPGGATRQVILDKLLQLGYDAGHPDNRLSIFEHSRNGLRG